MLSKRLIACLDVRNGCVVKGVNFEGLRNAGDPAALAKRYNQEGIDEVVVLDVTATLEGRRAFEATIRAVSSELFIPLAVGGGIRTEADAAAAIDAGADKVGVNSAALADPSLLTRLAQIAAERDCCRLEWVVLNWNEPAFRFYESLGAIRMSANVRKYGSLGSQRPLSVLSSYVTISTLRFPLSGAIRDM